MRERWYVIAVIFAYALIELWTLIPNDQFIKPFPLSTVELNLQTYIWMACLKSSFIILAFILCQYCTDSSFEFFVLVFWFAVAEVLEYFICYNEPWFRIFRVPVDITTIRYTVLSITAFKIWRQAR